MHPASSPPAGSAQPAAGWPPGSGGYGDAYAGQAGAQPQGPVVKRGRPGLIVLVSVLTEIVLIAGLANQWVTDYVVRHTTANSDRFVIRLLFAGFTYQWRFSPRGGNDPLRLLPAQLALIGVVLVATGLLVLAIARGTVSFGRVFFGTWMSVIVATQLGAIVRGYVVERRFFAAPGDRSTFAFFGSLGPSGSTFLAGAGLGLLVGLVTALVAVLSRRPIGVLVADRPRSEPAPQRAFQPAAFAGPRAESQERPTDAEQTRAFSVPWPESEERRASEQRSEQRPEQPPEPASDEVPERRESGDQPTQAFSPVTEHGHQSAAEERTERTEPTDSTGGDEGEQTAALPRAEDEPNDPNRARDHNPPG
jgi:hypothetical protein